MSFTRRIEDYVIVSLITVVIWFYAESRTLDQYAPTGSGPFPIQLRSTNKDMVITSQSVTRLSQLEFQGSRYAIGELRAALTGALVLDVDLTESGRVALPLARLVASSLEGYNVSLSRIEPDTVEVTAVRLVTRDAELRFNPNDVKLQDDEADIDPPTVSVTLPEDRIEDISVGGKLMLDVRPSRAADRDLRTQPINQKITIPGSVELPAALKDNEHVRVVPTTVQVSFIITQRGDSYTINAVPVGLNIPPGELLNFSVTFHEEDRFLQDVAVSGPAEIIEQIRAKTLALEARVKLTRDDLIDAAKKDEAVIPVKFVDIPQGLIVESPKTSVRVKVRKLNP